MKKNRVINLDDVLLFIKNNNEMTEEEKDIIHRLLVRLVYRIEVERIILR